MMKRKILERINKMNESELLKVSNELDVGASKVMESSFLEDKASVVTAERLKKFNEILGNNNGVGANGIYYEGDGAKAAEEDQEFIQQETHDGDDQMNPNEGG
jgi:hypothetical protein